VVILALEDSASCGAPRVPVLACRDALSAAGATVDVRTATCDADIDEVLERLPEARLIVAVSQDGELRAVVRRLVRRYAPAPSSRPAGLPDDRTVADLPPIGVLAMAPDGLASRLGLAADPATVARAVLEGRIRRLDLLRNDGGSVTLHGALFGAQDGRPVPFAARVEVDDAVLSDGTESLLLTAVANADGYSTVDGLPMVVGADPADGVVNVAVALPHTTRSLLGRRRVEVEVRRATGRAVAVTPRDEVPFVDDGVAGRLGRKRSWWIERGAWAVYDVDRAATADR
jgi:hypothetical protein